MLKGGEEAGEDSGEHSNKQRSSGREGCSGLEAAQGERYAPPNNPFACSSPPDVNLD